MRTAACPLTLLLTLAPLAARADPPTTIATGLRPVGSEAALLDAVEPALAAHAWRREFLRIEGERRARDIRRVPELLDAWNVLMDSHPSPPAAQGPPSPSELVTNNQEPGVDEGDIVKARGDALVVLRRGRIFSVRLGPRPSVVSAVDAWGPGATPATWYDELLLAGEHVIVTGYNQRERATEVSRFHFGADASLAWRDTIFIRSSDYYSSRNYASRIVGETLVSYAPVPLIDGEHLRLTAPSVRHGTGGAWEPVLDPARTFAPVQFPTVDPVLHLVLRCDLSGPRVACSGGGVIGPPQRTFYVSPRAIYLWVPAGVSFNGPLEAPAERAWARRPWIRDALLYRFPLDGGGVGAVRVRGGPFDSLSFRERGSRLHVLTALEGSGEAMWDAEWTASGLALASVPTAAFTRAVGGAAAVTYTPLPSHGEDGFFHTRFVGDHLLYGWRDMREFWGRRADDATRRHLYVHDLVRGRSHAVPLAHDVRRVEAIGRDALVVGQKEGDVLFSAVALGARPAVASTWLRADAQQGDDRSHGFFYRPTDATSGTLGLPVQASGQGNGAGAGVVFLTVRDRRLRPLGELHAAEAPWREDRCVASCVDWYGDARPLFVGERTFALLG